MKKIIITIAALLLLLAAFTGCGSSGEAIPDHVYTPPPPPPGGVLPPMVFVNDRLYLIDGSPWLPVPEPGDIWVYIGDIESVVPVSEHQVPTENFQGNHSAMWIAGIGARIYHSYNGPIPITIRHWDQSTYNGEIMGDSIIVVYGYQRHIFVTEEFRTEMSRMRNAVKRRSLQMDGAIHHHIVTISGGEFSTDGNVFLGEVESAVSIMELPSEDFQTNREDNVGMKIYRLPADAANDIVVFRNPNTTRWYFSR